MVENLTDSQGLLAGVLAPKLKELFGRVSSRHSSDAEIWRQYAQLYGGGFGADPEDNEKVGAVQSSLLERPNNSLHQFIKTFCSHLLLKCQGCSFLMYLKEAVLI